MNLILNFFWRLLRDPPSDFIQSSLGVAFLSLLIELASKFDVPTQPKEHLSSRLETIQTSTPPIEDVKKEPTKDNETNNVNSQPNPLTNPIESGIEQSSNSSHSLSTSATEASELHFESAEMQQYHPFPFQSQTINYDNNEEPTLVVRHFLRLINTLRFNNSRIFHRVCIYFLFIDLFGVSARCSQENVSLSSFLKVWNQLHDVISEHNEQNSALTSSQLLKTLAVQGLTSLLLRVRSVLFKILLTFTFLSENNTFMRPTLSLF
jgi:hypothetical protein